jgi:DNA-binding MarR family transcriptional regulator
VYVAPIAAAEMVPKTTYTTTIFVETENDVNAKELMESVVSFVRSFGLHRADQTPCGQAVTTAEAHTLVDLAGLDQWAGRVSFPPATGKEHRQPLSAKDEANRWIRRAYDRHDGRAILIRLTRQGQETATQVTRARQEKFARILSAIPEDKRSWLWRLSRFWNELGKNAFVHLRKYAWCNRSV